MQLERKQTLRAGAGLLAALALSVGIVAGCNPASFKPGPGSNNPAAPNTGTDNQKPLEFNTLAGQAAFKDGALKDAQIKVFDALTGKPAAVIASGGANVIAAGGGNLAVQSDNLTTDDKGNFSLQVAGLTPGNAARLVITTSDRQVSAIVTGDGALNKYQVQDVTFTLHVDEISTALDRIVAPMLFLAGAVTENSRTDLVAKLALGISTLGSDLKTAFEKNPQLVEDLTKPDYTKEEVSKVREKFDQFLKADPLILSKITNVVQETAQAVAVQVQNKQIQNNDALSGANFIGTDITITITGTSITIGDTVIDLTPTATATPAPTPAPTGQPTAGPTAGPTSQPIIEPTQVPTATEGAPVGSSLGAFNPTITATDKSTYLELKVSQPANTDDIESIVSRVKTTETSPNFSVTDFAKSGSTLTVTGTGTTYTVTVPGSSASATSAATLRLPAEFGASTVSASNCKWHGTLKADSISVASFDVYELNGYYYLVTSYMLNDAVKVNTGHTTTVNVDLVLAQGKAYETVLKSRNNNSVKRIDTVK